MGKVKDRAARLFEEIDNRADYSPSPDGAAFVADVLAGNAKRKNPKSRAGIRTVLAILQKEYGYPYGEDALHRWVCEHFGRRTWGAK